MPDTVYCASKSDKTTKINDSCLNSLSLSPEFTLERNPLLNFLFSTIGHVMENTL
jgi:hypothetical protein